MFQSQSFQYTFFMVLWTSFKKLNFRKAKRKKFINCVLSLYGAHLSLVLWGRPFKVCLMIQTVHSIRFGNFGFLCKSVIPKRKKDRLFLAQFIAFLNLSLTWTNNGLLTLFVLFIQLLRLFAFWLYPLAFVVLNFILIWLLYINVIIYCCWLSGHLTQFFFTKGSEKVRRQSKKMLGKSLKTVWKKNP